MTGGRSVPDTRRRRMTTTTFIAQITPTQVALIVSVLTILGFMAAVLRFMYNLGNRLGKVEQSFLDTFDAVRNEVRTNKTAADRVAAELSEHCDDDKQHVNVKLEEFREQVLNKRLDEMGQKLNLLLVGRPHA